MRQPDRDEVKRAPWRAVMWVAVVFFVADMATPEVSMTMSLVRVAASS